MTRGRSRSMNTGLTHRLAGSVLAGMAAAGSLRRPALGTRRCVRAEQPRPARCASGASPGPTAASPSRP